MDFPYELTDEEMLLRVKEWTLVGLTVAFDRGDWGWSEEPSMNAEMLKSCRGARVYQPLPGIRDATSGKLLASYGSVSRWAADHSKTERTGVWRQRDFTTGDRYR